MPMAIVRKGTTPIGAGHIGVALIGVMRTVVRAADPICMVAVLKGAARAREATVVLPAASMLVIVAGLIITMDTIAGMVIITGMAISGVDLIEIEQTPHGGQVINEGDPIAVPVALRGEVQADPNDRRQIKFSTGWIEIMTASLTKKNFAPHSHGTWMRYVSE